MEHGFSRCVFEVYSEYNISWKSMQLEPSSVRTDGRTDGKTWWGSFSLFFLVILMKHGFSRCVFEVYSEYNISWKSMQLEPSFVRTDGRKDMIRFIFAFFLVILMKHGFSRCVFEVYSKYNNSWKSMQLEPSSVRTDGKTWRGSFSLSATVRTRFEPLQAKALLVIYSISAIR